MMSITGLLSFQGGQLAKLLAVKYFFLSPVLHGIGVGRLLKGRPIFGPGSLCTDQVTVAAQLGWIELCTLGKVGPSIFVLKPILKHLAQK